MFISIFFVAILLPNIVISIPTTYSTTEQSLKEVRLPKLKCMHVTANIRNRYARTVVKSKYINPENVAQDVTFTITFPDTAFISGFKMYKEIAGIKEEIKREYQQAVESVSLDALRKRDSKTFTISVNVEPLGKVIFSLTYEQLLLRKHGKYEMIINLYPGELVDNLKVDVNINETRRIIDIHTPALRSGNEITEANKVAKNKFATISTLNNDETEVNIQFSPSVQEQKEMIVESKGADENKGISGQFVVEYDVEQDPDGGEIVTDDGYFAHFFAPSDLQPITKHIVFVLDVSYSMSGSRIKQLRDAMLVILGELNNKDYVHLVKFSTGVQVWNEEWKDLKNPTQLQLPQPYLANENNINNIKKVVEKMGPEGSTNFYDPLAIALQLTSGGVSNYGNEIQPVIVFLTDGQVNEGITNYNEILKMVNTRNVGNKAAIFTLSFGNSANEEFLKNVANNNLGFMRNIYDGADASLQLANFYDEISSPLLTQVNFIYSDEVSNVTNNKFDILFEGSECVVSGKLNDTADKFVSVEGRSFNGNQKFVPHYFKIIKNPEADKKRKYANLERLWAYMRIKQLLNKKYEITSTSPEKEALNIALKYSFVTPVTSLDDVQLNSTDHDNDDDPCPEPDFDQHLLNNPIGRKYFTFKVCTHVPCPEPDSDQRLLNNPLRLRIGGSGSPRKEMTSNNNLPMFGSFSGNSNILRFGGHSYSTTTFNYDSDYDYL